MALVFKKNEPKIDLSQTSMMIYSFPKTGKSSLAAAIKHGDKEPLFIATEEGHAALNVYSQRVVDWKQFLKVKDYILQNMEEVKNTFSTIVLDLVSDLDLFAAKHICEIYKVKDLSEMEWGRGYTLQLREIEAGIKPLLDVMPMVFISHSTEKEVTYNGEKIKAQTPSLSKRAVEYINGKCDLIGFIVPITTKNDKPYITFRPTTGIIAGSRFPWMVTDFPIDYNNVGETFRLMNETFINKGGAK